ncbi:MAG: hypothetical protein GY799_33875 [Desulfobulbaceae bacterium]|nr:hypothetical protein [Desulfobulbaceae bacterium]
MTRREAMIFIEKQLRKANKLERTDLVMDEENITEISTHWIIPYQSKRYLESGDAQHAVIGIAPYAIDKNTGKIDPKIDTSWM